MKLSSVPPILKEKADLPLRCYKVKKQFFLGFYAMITPSTPLYLQLMEEMRMRRGKPAIHVDGHWNSHERKEEHHVLLSSYLRSQILTIVKLKTMCSWHQLSDFYNCEKGDNYTLITGTDGTLALLLLLLLLKPRNLQRLNKTLLLHCLLWTQRMNLMKRLGCLFKSDYVDRQVIHSYWQISSSTASVGHQYQLDDRDPRQVRPLTTLSKTKPAWHLLRFWCLQMFSTEKYLINICLVAWWCRSETSHILCLVRTPWMEAWLQE